ncbi:MAG: ABC transporter substrate-binding protein, partial [Deltaproteobacteria bacterium]|nr:ABC transporter substrate-binding protein [Deltaproteobacteria bacterium]
MRSIILLSAIFAFSSPSLYAEDFVVGGVLPLTGPTADYGQAMVNSITLAREEHPELFSRLKFVFEDAQYSNSLAVTAFQKLRTQDRAEMIYTWGVGFCQALAPLAEQDKLPTVGQCIDPDSSRGKTFFIRFMNPVGDYLSLQTQYLAFRNAKNIGVVLADSSYLELMVKSLESSLLPGQHLEIIQRYSVNNMDLRDSLAKIRNRKFDAVGVFLSAGQISSFYKLRSQQKIEVPTFGTNFFESLSEVQSANELMDGAVYVNNIVDPGFSARYEKRFGMATQLAFGAPAYEFALQLARLTQGEAPGQIGGISILQKLKNLGRIDVSSAGPYKFETSSDAGGFFAFPLSVKMVCGNSFIELSRDRWRFNNCIDAVGQKNWGQFPLSPIS